MKKKLALLLAFTGNPKLVLLDEPYNTLDPEARENLTTLIRQYADAGVSFILATHQNHDQQALPIQNKWTIRDHRFYQMALK